MQKIKKKYRKIHVHKGEEVKIISGQYTGKIGTIKNIIYKKNAIIIENLNTAKKHVKATKGGENGEIVLIEKPIHSSNVIKYNENKVN